MTDLGLDDVFQGTYLKAADLEGKEHKVVIASAVPKIMGTEEKPDPKVHMTFQGWTKPFLCNKTNGERIAFRHGRKFAGWIGKEIVLYPDMVDFQGKAVEAIRVRHVRTSNAQVENKGRYDTLKHGSGIAQPGDQNYRPPEDDGEQEVPF